MLKKLMEQMGMDPERLRLEWVSAAEGEKFAKVVTEFTNMLKDKGQCQLKAALSQEAD
jgi:F420-non-reducing hydrogenase iron-sulfur subunit